MVTSGAAALNTQATPVDGVILQSMSGGRMMGRCLHHSKVLQENTLSVLYSSPLQRVSASAPESLTFSLLFTSGEKGKLLTLDFLRVARHNCYSQELHSAPPTVHTCPIIIVGSNRYSSDPSKIITSTKNAPRYFKWGSSGESPPRVGG